MDWAAITGATARRTKPVEQSQYPYPTIDTESRYNLVQLRVRNTGGGAAHDIALEWDKPLQDSDGNNIVFTEQSDAPDIPVLLPGESIAVLIDTSVQFFPNVEDANYTGTVRFKDSSGHSRSHKFYLNAERHRKTLAYDQEEPKTHYKLQDIPDRLKDLTREVSKIHRTLEGSRN